MNTVHLMGYRSFLSLILNELLQSEIVQKLTSLQKITCISVITDKKINFTLYISSVVFHLSLWFKLNSFFSLVLFLLEYFCLLEYTKDEEKKVTGKTIKCKEMALQKYHLPFLLLKIVKISFGKLSVLSTTWEWRKTGKWRGYVICVIVTHSVWKSICGWPLTFKKCTFKLTIFLSKTMEI